MKPEGIVESHMVALAKKNNILCFKFTSPGNNGVPDRILIGNNKVIFVELKAKTKVPRKLQEKIISKMRKAGADVRTADTKEKVDQIIDEIIK